MDKKKSLAAIILAAGILAVILVIEYEQVAVRNAKIPTLDYTDEQILEGGYFDIIVPAKENRNLYSDIKSYSFGDGYVHIVLPSKVSDRNLVFYIRDENGEYLSRRECDFSKEVRVGQWQIVVDRPVLPCLYFDTASVGDFAEMLARENTDMYCYGDMRISVDEKLAKEKGWHTEYISAKTNTKDGYSAALKGRGSSSWDCDSKKSFSLRLSKSIDLLGLGNNKSYNLIGSAYDVSLLKNTTFNEVAKAAGVKYQPKMQCVNLYVNGEYQGVYILTTKVSVGKNRIALGKHDYLYKMDAPTQDQPIKYDSLTWFEDGNTEPVADLLYPENATNAQLEDAKYKLQRVIDAIENPSSEDLYELVDVESLIRYYWVQEASMNFDAWQRSVYMYYSYDDGKVHFGPVWDMDLTLGSPYEKQGMMFDYPYGYRTRFAGWYKSLFAREDFVEDVADIYYNKGVREALFDGIDEFINQKETLSSDAYLNFAFYGYANQGTTLMYGENYDEYCDNMIDFYRERLKWIDEAMSQGTNY